MRKASRRVSECLNMKERCCRRQKKKGVRVSDGSSAEQMVVFLWNQLTNIITAVAPLPLTSVHHQMFDIRLPRLAAQVTSFTKTLAQTTVTPVFRNSKSINTSERLTSILSHDTVFRVSNFRCSIQSVIVLYSHRLRSVAFFVAVVRVSCDGQRLPLFPPTSTRV
jgi:hypothetical protein